MKAKTKPPKLKNTITVQKVAKGESSPSAARLQQWCEHVLKNRKIKHAELCIRIVGEKESAKLNSTYRHKKGATNVLSFTTDLPATLGVSMLGICMLGDLVICGAVVNREAKEQGKTRQAHWAHMVVHGSLHLLGFDHLQEADAITMEKLEVRILKQLGFDNPYN